MVSSIKSKKTISQVMKERGKNDAQKQDKTTIIKE